MGVAVIRLAALMGLSAEDVVSLTPLNISQKERDKAASSGHSLPDGSFPCDTTTEVEHAIQSWGRCPAEHRSALKALLRRRATDLQMSDDVLQRIDALQE